MNAFTKVHGVGILFNQDILIGKSFYTNKNHSSGNIETSNKYKINENAKLSKILHSLYYQSLKIVKKIKMDFWIMSTFQEVFTKSEPKLNDAVYVIIDTKELKTIKIIKKLYPNIQIIGTDK